MKIDKKAFSKELRPRITVTFKMFMKCAEYRYLRHLIVNSESRTQAILTSGLSRATFYRKLKKYKL